MGFVVSAFVLLTSPLTRHLFIVLIFVIEAEKAGTDRCNHRLAVSEDPDSFNSAAYDYVATWVGPRTDSEGIQIAVLIWSTVIITGHTFSCHGDLKGVVKRWRALTVGEHRSRVPGLDGIVDDRTLPGIVTAHDRADMIQQVRKRGWLIRADRAGGHACRIMRILCLRSVEGSRRQAEGSAGGLDPHLCAPSAGRTRRQRTNIVRAPQWLALDPVKLSGGRPRMQAAERPK